MKQKLYILIQFRAEFLETKNSSGHTSAWVTTRFTHRTFRPRLNMKKKIYIYV